MKRTRALDMVSEVLFSYQRAFFLLKRLSRCFEENSKRGSQTNNLLILSKDGDDVAVLTNKRARRK